MSASTSTDVARLLREAIDVYADDPIACNALKGYARRLEEPPRVTVAGMVKAGKSTLINAMIGEEVAPTGTTECTQIVTWYRYRATPQVTMFLANGESHSLPVNSVRGRLLCDIGDTHPQSVDRLVVDWPAQKLREMTLIDTPGIASPSGRVSARSTDFLVAQSRASETDAMVYVMRRLHEADLQFLAAFRDATASRLGAVDTVAVLSRADEVGAGRIGSLLAAKNVATRYRADESLRGLVSAIIPVAGLLAQTARAPRRAEFAALTELSRLDRVERERMLLSADRFVRTATQGTSSPKARAALLDRFGLFGIRLAIVLIRSGITEPMALANELTRRSGLDELSSVISRQFLLRAKDLQVRNVVIAIETMLKQRAHAGTDTLAASLEGILAGAHEFRELRLLSAARRRELALAPELTAEAQRLVGGSGTALSDRLGLDQGAEASDLRSDALSCLSRWRTLAANPMNDRGTADMCQTVVRSCEAILAELG
ncbi:MAG: GTP-binding protein [Homoserinimonas sp.]|nr:GTP-binding protein [Homoserinimonas sp.]